ncbi:MAG: hypothetical protein HZA89_11465 [Verrucomicrobia bacterium]|nr:hypothetical protein [Verrucomicrobiota bacterium]
MWQPLTSASGSQRLLVGALAFFLAAPSLPAKVSEAEFQQLREQNRRLEEQVKRQQELIDQLSVRFSEFQRQGRPAPPPDADKDGKPPADHKGGFLDQLHIGGEIGLGLFHTGNKGAYAKSPFRVDEAKLFLEAPIWENVYLYTELDLIIREADTEFFKLGEVYLDAEDLSRLWGRERQLNLRFGRFYIPFGEEYSVRRVMDNPLVSHSLADFWGVDEGVALYGTLGKFQYIVAVQNGGHPLLKDYNADKSVAARIGFDPAPWLHVSASAMRTGALDVKGDALSELWFGNGFFRSVGSASTTTFEADLAELDARVKWRSGHMKLSGGGVRYDDDDPLADNRRTAYFYSAEMIQSLSDKLYGATRFSGIHVARGLPIVGHGNAGTYFFSPVSPLTQDLWRWSLGLGYRFSPKLILKAEYAMERGQVVSGASRDDDFLGLEVGLKF